MEKTRIVLSGLWVSLMLTYLLGDVRRVLPATSYPGRWMALGDSEAGRATNVI
jgi:hypothetical protein